ncbi:major capsid protein [uncultured Tateyamaria sp.]|uniref:major capsid protein n=1 Tax=uncultured Tateyamaria sp. TaxID=455651 RepID=UPI002601908C|nr:hypothetical protein [uncultured Tateyamaria sp.]
MAIIGNSFLGLRDIYKGTDGKGDVADIIDILAQTNSILTDVVTRPCNMKTKHKHTIRNGLPEVVWGQLYRGIPASKSERTQVEDTTGFLEGLSQVDVRLGEIEENLDAFRLQEAHSYLEAISQEWARAIFYESETANSDRITGLAPRFSKLSSDTAEIGSQIIDCGGTGGNNTSLWFITHGMDSFHLIYPSGTNGGIMREDHGKQNVTDADGRRYYAYEETFRVHTGGCVRDWRKIVRLANIDSDRLRTAPDNLDGNGNSIYDFMRRGYYQLHGKRRVDFGTPGGSPDGNFAMGSTCIYANRDVLEALDALGTNAGASDNFVRLKPMEVQGMEVDTYRGMKISQVDQIVNTEARVT